MVSLIASLLGGGGGQVLDGVAHVVDSIKGKNPEDAAEFAEKYKSDLLVAQLEGESGAPGPDADERLGGPEHLRGDHVSRSLRPAGSRNAAMGGSPRPAPGIWTAAKPFDLPQFFWYAWMFAIGGYVASRVADRALGGSGGGLSFYGDQDRLRRGLAHT
jgi:hypothetical protein